MDNSGRIVLAKVLARFTFSVLLFVGLFEAAAGFLLNHADLTSFKPDDVLHKYYMNVERNLIQFKRKCARYDKDQTYTLRPGTFRFSNREFNTTYHVNSMGMRDDEESLAEPEIVVVGDSFAMGWGVEQDETFAQIIERETNMSVLNTAVSSYGTVRELKMLSRAPLNKVKYLLIQYCSNDWEEKARFAQNSNSLPIMGEAEYDEKVRTQGEKSRYYFGKRTLYCLESMVSSL